MKFKLADFPQSSLVFLGLCFFNIFQVYIERLLVALFINFSLPIAFLPQCVAQVPTLYCSFPKVKVRYHSNVCCKLLLKFLKFVVWYSLQLDIIYMEPVRYRFVCLLCVCIKYLISSRVWKTGLESSKSSCSYRVALKNSSFYFNFRGCNKQVFNCGLDFSISASASRLVLASLLVLSQIPLGNRYFSAFLLGMN